MNRTLVGGGMLLRRLTSWLTGEKFLTAAGRVICTILTAAFCMGLLAAAPILWWFLATGWLIASWCATPTQAAEPAEESDPSDPEPDLDLDQFVTALYRLVGGPTGRVHLVTVAEHLGITGQAVREMCTAAGIPYDAVRVPGKGSSTGIKAEHLPPLPSAPAGPVVDVVAAGQSNNNNNTRTGFYSHPNPDPDGTEIKITWITEKAS